jgi:hypothetical protein
MPLPRPCLRTLHLRFMELQDRTCGHPPRKLEMEDLVPGVMPERDYHPRKPLD